MESNERKYCATLFEIYCSISTMIYFFMTLMLVISSAHGINSRKIILLKQGTEEVVQFGIVRFNFDYVTAEVSQAILSEKIPLGRILIEHNVLRHIDLGALLKIHPGPELCELFGCSPADETYGRLATIFCNHRPAVDLLEVSVPL